MTTKHHELARARLVSRELIGGPFDGLEYPMDGHVRRLEIGASGRIHIYQPDADLSFWIYRGSRGGSR